MGVEARRYVDFIDIINHVDRRKNSISIGRLLLLFLIRDYYLKKKKIKTESEISSRQRCKERCDVESNIDISR